MIKSVGTDWVLTVDWCTGTKLYTICVQLGTSTLSLNFISCYRSNEALQPMWRAKILLCSTCPLSRLITVITPQSVNRVKSLEWTSCSQFQHAVRQILFWFSLSLSLSLYIWVHWLPCCFYFSASFQWMHYLSGTSAS